MKILFKTGIALLLVSIFYAVFLDWFTYISIWLFGIGLAFITVSLLARLLKLNIPNLIQITIILLPFAIGISYWTYSQRDFKRALIIPSEFEGLLTVEYGIETGKKVEKKHGYYLINVDTTRVVKVSFSPFKDRLQSLEGMVAYWDTFEGKQIPEYYSGQESAEKGIYYVECSDTRCIFVITADYDKYFKPHTFNELREKPVSIHLESDMYAPTR